MSGDNYAAIQELYAKNGQELDENGIKEELTAESTWDILYPTLESAQTLVEKKPGLVRRIVNRIASMLNKMRGISDPEIDKLQKTRDLYRQCLETANRNNSVESTNNRFVGTLDDGTKVYSTNFEEGVSKDVKRQHIIDLWQNVWSKKLIMLEINDNGTKRTISANFDPSYDLTGKVPSDIGKFLSNKNGSSGDRNVTLNLADDLYEIASEAKYIDSEV